MRGNKMYQTTSATAASYATARAKKTPPQRVSGEVEKAGVSSRERTTGSQKAAAFHPRLSKIEISIIRVRITTTSTTWRSAARRKVLRAVVNPSIFYLSIIDSSVPPPQAGVPPVHPEPSDAPVAPIGKANVCNPVTP